LPTEEKFVDTTLFAVIAAISALAIGGILWLYDWTGIVAFFQELSSQLHVNQLFMWTTPIALWVIWYIYGSIVKDSSKSIVDPALFSIAFQASWTVAIAGLLTGQHGFVMFEAQRSWFSHVPSMTSWASPLTIAIASAVISAPLAIRSFYSVAPVYFPWKRHRSYGKSYSSSTYAATAWNANAHSGAKSSYDQQPGYRRALTRSGGKAHFEQISFIWIGILIAFGTLCGIAASSSGGMSLLHVTFAGIASLIAGAAAALQWRLSSKKG
jgi:hypothetical protein